MNELEIDWTPPSDPATMDFEQLLVDLQKAESLTREWPQGWDEFFWRIGKSSLLWDDYASLPWVLPEIYSRTNKYESDSDCEAAALSQRFKFPSQRAMIQVGNLRMLKEEVRHPISYFSHWMYAAGAGQLHILKFFLEKQAWCFSATLEAAKNDHVNVLTFACDHDLKFHSQTAYYAAKHDSRQCLAFCFERSLHIPPETSVVAAERGLIECLKLFLKHKHPLNPLVIRSAAKNGQLSCLVFLLEQGVAWDPSATVDATYYDHVQCLEFFLKQRLPFSDQTSLMAATRRAHKCLSFCKENFNLWHPDTTSAALATNNQATIQIALS